MLKIWNTFLWPYLFFVVTVFCKHNLTKYLLFSLLLCLSIFPYSQYLFTFQPPIGDCSVWSWKRFCPNMFHLCQHILAFILFHHSHFVIIHRSIGNAYCNILCYIKSPSGNPLQPPRKTIRKLKFKSQKTSKNFLFTLLIKSLNVTYRMTSL